MIYKNIKDENEILLKCDCCGDCHGIYFILDEDDEQIYVSVQPEGTNALKELSLWGRLKQASKIIFQHKCYYDNLCLDYDTFNDFVNRLKQFQNKIQ
jgi:hypothetical protein